jgi:hypothetical protein
MKIIDSNLQKINIQKKNVSDQIFLNGEGKEELLKKRFSSQPNNDIQNGKLNNNIDAIMTKDEENNRIREINNIKIVSYDRMDLNRLDNN